MCSRTLGFLDLQLDIRHCTQICSQAQAMRRPGGFRIGLHFEAIRSLTVRRARAAGQMALVISKG
jgi:hypothetical protein